MHCCRKPANQILIHTRMLDDTAQLQVLPRALDAVHSARQFLILTPNLYFVSKPGTGQVILIVGIYKLVAESQLFEST